MHSELLLKAAAQFGTGTPAFYSMPGGFTRCDYGEGKSPALLLQCINRRTIPLPENIIGNYQLIKDYLQHQRATINMAELVQTHHQKLYWMDDYENFWLAFELPAQTAHHEVLGQPATAYSTAKFFAGFTRSLTGLDVALVSMIAPGHHELGTIFQQFEAAISTGKVMRLLRATHVISELRQRRYLLRFSNRLADATRYPTRIMNHDAAIENLLFSSGNGQPLLVINFQRLMPGKFFSDPGELIRTGVSPVDENSTAWEDIAVRPAFYEAIVSGYLDGAGGLLTAAEKQDIHFAGLAICCIQCLRFVTDFIRNDIYFSTTYPEQNLNRALNQLILLEKLEDYLQSTHHFSAEG